MVDGNQVVSAFAALEPRSNSSMVDGNFKYDAVRGLVQVGSNSSMVDGNPIIESKDDFMILRSNSSMVDGNVKVNEKMELDMKVQIPLWSMETGFPGNAESGKAFKFLYGRWKLPAAMSKSFTLARSNSSMVDGNPGW